MSEVSNGKTSLVGYIRAFERVNGRTPTEAENREALALVEVVRESNLDPFLVYYLANKKAQDALERVPIETRAIIAESQKGPGNLAPQMARLEALLRQASAQADPLGAVLRYFFAFGAGAAVCEAVFFALSYRWLPPVFGLVGMFVLGLSATAAVLLWLWLEPIVKRQRR